VVTFVHDEKLVPRTPKELLESAVGALEAGDLSNEASGVFLVAEVDFRYFATSATRSCGKNFSASCIHEFINR